MHLGQNVADGYEGAELFEVELSVEAGGKHRQDGELAQGIPIVQLLQSH